MQTRLISHAVKLLWASPCSLVGLFFAAIVLLLGGRVDRSAGTLEVTFRNNKVLIDALMHWLPFHAITLGHVIIAVTQYELERLRAHERVHVQQYERWGIAFFVAYPVASMWQLIRGRHAYWDNSFEVEARLLSAKDQATKCDT